MSYPGWRWDGKRWQPAPGTRKQHTGLIVTLSIVCALLTLCFGRIAVASVLGDSGSHPSEGEANGSSLTNADKTPEPLPTVGRDGQFEFRVVSVESGVAEVNQMPDNEFWKGETAQGEFVLVTIKVTNIGDSARTLSDSNQYAYDEDDRKFEADTSAGWEANKGTDMWLTDINPGNSVTGILVFDVPPDTKLVRLELHDSFLSGGVEVGLP